MDGVKDAGLPEKRMEAGFGGKTVSADASVTGSVQKAMSRLALTDKVAGGTVHQKRAGIEIDPSRVIGVLQSQVSGAVEVQAGPASAVLGATVQGGSDTGVPDQGPGVASAVVPVGRKTVQFSEKDSVVSVNEVEDLITTRSIQEPEGEAARQARDDGWDIWRECTLHQIACQLERNYEENPLHVLTDSLQEVVDLVLKAPDVLDNIMFHWLSKEPLVVESMDLVFGELEKVLRSTIAQELEPTLTENTRLKAKVQDLELIFHNAQSESELAHNRVVLDLEDQLDRKAKQVEHLRMNVGGLEKRIKEMDTNLTAVVRELGEQQGTVKDQCSPYILNDERHGGDFSDYARPVVLHSP